MTSIKHKVEVLSGPERRRRWSTAEKLAIIQETYEADATVSVVARRHGIQPNQLFAWRKLASQGALTATAAEEEVVPASEYRALQAQVKELQRLLGKKTMEGEILKEALEIATGPKNVWPAPFARGFYGVLISLRQRIRSHEQAHGQDGHPRVQSPINRSAVNAIFLAGLSKRRSTVRPSSRSFLQISLGYACCHTASISIGTTG